MKKQLLVLILMSICFSCLSQNNKSERIQKKIEEIGYQLINDFQLNQNRFLDKECKQGVLFIRICIDSNLNITEILSSENVESKLNEFVISKLSKSINSNSKIGSYYFLLPIMYHLELNCTPVNETFRQTFTMIDFDKNTQSVEKKEFGWGKKFIPLDCKILSPLFLRSPIK
jgi:hypothetical protein